MEDHKEYFAKFEEMCQSVLPPLSSVLQQLDSENDFLTLMKALCMMELFAGLTKTPRISFAAKVFTTFIFCSVMIYTDLSTFLSSPNSNLYAQIGLTRASTAHQIADVLEQYHECLDHATGCRDPTM